MVRSFELGTRGKGLYEITGDITRIAAEAGIREGLCTVYIRHTSASLVIQENADPAVRVDLEAWLSRLVREDDDLYTHTSEGPDDMPAHIKCALTSTSIGIPIEEGRLALGTWQGIYVWEHRTRPHTRRVTVHVGD